MNRRYYFLVFLAACLLVGCNASLFAAHTATATQTETPPPPTETITPSPTFPAISTTSAPLPEPSPTWVAQGPDHIRVPILLYHHIAVSPIDSRYYVSPSKFEEEIKLLHDWNYTPITTSMLVEAITNGTSLPPRPIIITFDDGHEDNYLNAFPIMKKYGFVGVLYLVVTYMNTPTSMTTDEAKEMAAAGWEIGSHSETHPSLVVDMANLRYEIVQSRKDLQTMLGVPILTFAYPFGIAGSGAIDYVKFAKYIGAMGASGFTGDQGKGNLFLLQRCEIKGSDDAKTIVRFLPWLGDPAFLPTDTPTATAVPTRTPIPTYTQYPTRTPKVTQTP
jgi:peptidoglycan/xylan/chitin deacetylase (PgdA/CDA1 family)